MKKSILKIIFTIIIIIVATIIITKIKSNKEINTYSYVNIFDEADLNKIEQNQNEKQDNTVLLVNNSKISKSDIEIQENRIKNMTDEEKKIIGNSGDSIIEAVKQNIEQQEALKHDIKVSQEQKEIYNQVAEEMYKNSDKVLSKEEYIEKWTKIQEKDEISDLYMAKIMKEIVLNELKCSDEKVHEAIQTFNNQKTVESLMNAYNEYLLYLCKQYIIKY